MLMQIHIFINKTTRMGHQWVSVSPSKYHNTYFTLNTLYIFRTSKSLINA